MVIVVFDLDGTLVDSAPAIRDVANTLMAEEGLAPLDLDETRRHIGHGMVRFLAQTLASRRVANDPETMRRLRARFEVVYRDAPGAANVPYPGVVDLLDRLAHEGHRLGVCTNKPGAPTRSVLSAHGWLDRFGVVVAGDTLTRMKPDPEPLQHAIRSLGAGPAVYVGDSEVDAETASRARVPFLLFEGGYRKSPVAQIPAHSTFAHHGEVLRLIAAVAGD